MTHSSRLPRYLCAAWALLTLYACLHPFAGWTDSGVSPWAFLTAPWPKYNQPSDIFLNVVGFLPLGFFLALFALMVGSSRFHGEAVIQGRGLARFAQ